MSGVRVSADLRFSFTGPQGEQAAGRVTGTGSRLRLDLDHPEVFAGGADSGTVQAAAEELAHRGISVRVVHDGVHLVTIGAVKAPWWQRRATGSRHIRVGSLRGAWTSLRSRAAIDRPAVLPDSRALPPPTMLPVAPTFTGRRRRRVTTTHDPHGTGAPRLVVEKQDVWAGERQTVFWLGRGETTLGSDPACDVVLPGLEPLHATVRRNEVDEYVITSSGAEVRVHGARVVSQVLRTGARIDLGPHSLAYARDEYADHGRPFGGRVGGEAGRQRSQPDPRRGGSPSAEGPV